MWEGVGDSAIRLLVPVLILSLGELISQRSGVINIGLEGKMAAGAFAGYCVMAQTGNPTLAVLAALAAGVAVALVMVAFSIWGQVDQILVGFSIFILVPGLTAFLYAQGVGGGITPMLDPLAFPGLSQIPWVGEMLFKQNAFYWVAFALGLLTWLLLAKTHLGLWIQAAGHNPVIAATQGVPVRAVRTTAVLICGAFAGIAGAALTVGALGSFSPGVTGGRGFIAIAIVILGRWKQMGVVLAAVAVAVADAMRLRLSAGTGVPVQIVAMAPWIVMLVMLIAGARWGTPPFSLGKNPREVGRT